MTAIDQTAIERLGIPRLLLMEHAGMAVAAAVRALAAPPAAVAACCGGGFNGGDALAALRLLHHDGYRTAAILTTPPAALRGEPAVYARILQRLGVRLMDAAGPARVRDAAFAAAAVLIDGLLGIGLRGPVREPAAGLIRRMNAARAPVVAVDLPSGLDGDDGSVHGYAVRATVTVACGLAKQGCLRGQGPAHTGRLMVDDITFPPALLTP